MPAAAGLSFATGLSQLIPAPVSSSSPSAYSSSSSSSTTGQWQAYSAGALVPGVGSGSLLPGDSPALLVAAAASASSQPQQWGADDAAAEASPRLPSHDDPLSALSVYGGGGGSSGGDDDATSGIPSRADSSNFQVRPPSLPPLTIATVTPPLPLTVPQGLLGRVRGLG